MDRKGIIFVVSAPSGAGKTSLCREVTKLVPNIQYSISYTTRAPRPTEVHGKDYFFVDEATFRNMADRNDFIEWAEVHGNLYGTSRELMTDWINRGIDVVLDIDSQGAMTLKKKHNDGVYIYILPPSFEILRQRLIDRKSDSHEEIARRLQKAREEIWNYRQYYYLIVNSEFHKALKELEAVIIAERIKMKQMTLSWIEETFIKQMSKEI
ncbi:MAG: guanylate kinase [Nitrospirae bacterium]|nr:guanylate kinase [Candidatus Manganitrophaceae bacterium]